MLSGSFVVWYEGVVKDFRMLLVRSPEAAEPAVLSRSEETGSFPQTKESHILRLFFIHSERSTFFVFSIEAFQ